MIWEVIESLRGETCREVFRSLGEGSLNITLVSWDESKLTLKSLLFQQSQLSLL